MDRAVAFVSRDFKLVANLDLNHSVVAVVRALFTPFSNYLEVGHFKKGFELMKMLERKQFKACRSGFKLIAVILQFLNQFNQRDSLGRIL